MLPLKLLFIQRGHSPAFSFQPSVYSPGGAEAFGLEKGMCSAPQCDIMVPDHRSCGPADLYCLVKDEV